MIINRGEADQRPAGEDKLLEGWTYHGAGQPKIEIFGEKLGRPMPAMRWSSTKRRRIRIKKYKRWRLNYVRTVVSKGCYYYYYYLFDDIVRVVIFDG